MARIKARIKPRPMVAQSRAESRATEEREFARKDAAEVDALQTTHQAKLASMRWAAANWAKARATEMAAEVDALQTTHQERLASLRRAAADWAKARATEIAAEVDALQTTHQERLAIGRTRSSERRHTRATEMAAEVDALRITQMEKKDAREAEEKRRVAKELVDRKARQEKINDEHMHTDEKKLDKLFEDQKEEARVQKAADDAAEKGAVDHLSSFTAAVDTRRSELSAWVSTLTAEVNAMRTTHEEQARNRQEAASKKESEYKDAADGLRRASLERAEQHAKQRAEVEAEQA